MTIEADMADAPVLRRDVVQACLDLFEKPRYLEIGVWKGKTFFPVKAGAKVAVDPTFAFDVPEMAKRHADCEFHQVTSDGYFAKADPSEKFQVIYLDGLHTAEQTLRDLLNAVYFISTDGIIIIDDVYPTSYHSALPDNRNAQVVKRAMKSEDKNWMGDVYKLTFFIDTFMQQLSYRMVANNHGQLVIWKKTRPEVRQRSLEQVARAGFETIFVEHEAQQRANLEDIIKIIRAERSISAPRAIA
jgi:hypothetical protein